MSNVSVFGIGYVGVVSAACLAVRGHRVWGVDVSPEKVERLNAGSSPIVEPGVEERIKNAVGTGRLKATLDPEEALEHSELCFVTVATPAKESGQIDSAYLFRACTQIAQTLSRLNRNQTVIIRSSVLPRIYHECEKIFATAAPDHVELGVNPEFLREGTAVTDYENPAFIIIGTANKSIEEKLRRLYAEQDAPIFVLPPDQALMIKYSSNVYHALKVAFANEIAAICKANGIDGHGVMDVFCQDKASNISSMYLTPGFAFGGSCLP